MKNPALIPLVVLVAFAAGSCTRTLYVAPRQTECAEGAGIPCYLIRSDTEGNWVIHEKPIDGLQYEPGFSFKIKVKKAVNGEAQYAVVEVLEKKDMTEAIDPTDLQGKEWKLQSMRADTTTYTPGEVTPTITFTEDGKISGFAGCNRFFGSYSLSGRTLKFSGIGATKMYCEETMSLEDSFLKLLSGERRVLFRESKLLLTAEDGSVMVFGYE